MAAGIALNPFEAAAALVVLTATLAWINHRFLRMPQTVGLTAMGAIASLAVVAIDQILPGGRLAEGVGRFLANVDFEHTLMQGMLSFLLFAGALHVDLDGLSRGRWQVGILSTLGVIASTLIVGYGLHLIAGLLGHELPLIWCMVFGALISPTDPVAVMGVVKTAKVPPTLQATIAGESLFNDGVGVVIFSILLAAATGTMGEVTLLKAGEMFAVEALGGAAFGLALGWVAYHAMKAIDD